MALAFATAVPAASPARPAGMRAASATEPRSALDEAVRTLRGFNFQSLRLAVADLSTSFPPEYINGPVHARRLDALEARARPLMTAFDATDPALARQVIALASELRALREEALLGNPLLKFDRLLLVKHDAEKLRLPRNDACYSSIPQHGYDCEISILSPVAPTGRLTTLFKPPGGKYLADVELNFEADKLLFTMPGANRWQVFELNGDGMGLRQVTRSAHDDVDHFDPCYLPNGSILFCSTANGQSVPCYNGTRRVGGIYLMDPKTGTVRQLTFDQDDNSYPTVMNNGRVMFTRWEYAGTPHFFTRLVFQMNPDGTGQEELYGSNSYWPNAIYGARAIPGHASQFIGIVSGHHGDRRMGELVLFDAAKGRQETAGVVQRIPGRGRPVLPVIKDTLVNESWPKFMHPWPLSEKYFLVACKPGRRAEWGIYLADVFDNLLLLCESPGHALLEPVPWRKTAPAPVIPDRVDPKRNDALVYMVDVYEGPGLKDVPRGTISRLRVISPHYGYFGNAGWLNIGIDGPWDVQRILGTVPVQPDGSAYFRVPANTPISVQPLDAEGKAVQLMRSWFTGMRGEVKSCTGCHEGHARTSANQRTLALSRPPAEIEPWFGPPRGFSFEREVQPVLEVHCVRCHDGKPQRDGRTLVDLRARKFFPKYEGTIAPIPQVITNGQLASNVTIDDVGVETSPLSERHQQRIKFSPAYEALHPHVRRGGTESDALLLTPGEFHADTSGLVQMLRKGHHDVQLDPEAWDRLITWIDLNVPYHGTWHEVYPIPFGGRERRLEYLKLYGGIEEDYEAIPQLAGYNRPAAQVGAGVKTAGTTVPPVKVAGFPFDAHEARERQVAAAALHALPPERTIELAAGVALTLVLVPAGEFVMGNAQGANDERPLHRVSIPRPFWMGRFEVRNREYRLFDPRHDSGYISQLGTAVESRGYPVNADDQPVVRVSWRDAMAFCAWLSKQTGMVFSLPSEAQWEHACRAGAATPLWYGGENVIFNGFGNLADRSLEEMARRRPGMLYRDHPDWVLRDNRSFDQALVTTTVGRFLPNPWGLHDLHGNAAEWTRSGYRQYPYVDNDGRNEVTVPSRRVVRGGSWYDRPRRAGSGVRLDYPEWQRVYNVGFRVVAEVEPAGPTRVAGRR